MAQISCQNLTLGYNGKSVIKDLSFEVNQGDYLVIVGENGAGKSTLMKGILGLIQPLAGKLMFDEELSSGTMGYLPQQTLIQRDFPASVKEVVLSGCQAAKKFSPFYNKSDKATALKNMEKMGISHLSNVCFRNLSGGQQQRVLLARALCATKAALLLDEPVTGLDPTATADLYQAIKTLNKEGVTIIMISHHIHSALTDASHVLHLGQLTFWGTTEEYKQSPLGKLFLKEEALEHGTII